MLGRQDLTTVHAVGQSLALGPIASVGIVGPLIAAQAGAASPLVVVISFAGTLCLGWTLTQYARRYAGAGGIYEWLVHVHGRTIGVLATGMSLLAMLLAAAGIPVLIGVLWESFALSQLHVDVPWWTGSLVATVGPAAAMYFGARLSIRTQLLLTALSLVPFCIVAVALIARPEAGNTLSVFDPRSSGAGDLFRASLFGLALFGGFEASACLGEEEASPHRSIPRAMLLTIVGAGAFYLLVFYAVVVGFGVDRVATSWGTNPGALALLADQKVGAPLGAMLDLAIVVDLLAVMVALGNALSRGLFALARDRLLPAPLAMRSRHDTPLGGIVALTVAGLLTIGIGILSGNPFKLFEVVAIQNVVLATPIIFLLAAGAIRLFAARRAELLIRLPIILAGAAVPALALYATLNPFPTGPARWGLGLVVSVLAVTVGWGCWLFSTRAPAVAQAAAYARTPASAGPSSEPGG